VRKSRDNPPENSLPSGLDQELVEEAVRRSGYPLQAVVATELAPFVNVTEEWSFLDDERKESRPLDIFGYKQLVDSKSTYRLIPALVLLVECKRSDLPYIFFKSAIPRPASSFPTIYGLSKSHIAVKNPMGSYREVEPATCLGLQGLPFVASGPPLCTSLTKSARKGKRLELSGTVPFNRLMRPLAKALDHAARYYKGHDNQEIFYPDLALALCVLDAPMLVAEASPSSAKLTLTPWVRVVRQEARPDRDRSTTLYHTVDVVHRHFLQSFITEHALPFANIFKDRALQMEEILVKAEGVVNDLDSWTWEEIRPSVPIRRR
jgi:hypothetical protein